MTPQIGPMDGGSRPSRGRRFLRSVLESFAESGFILWGFGSTMETATWAERPASPCPAARIPAPRRSSDLWPSAT